MTSTIQPGKADVECVGDPDERCPQPLVAECRRAVHGGIGREADDRDQRRDHDDHAQPGEEPSRHCLAGLTRLRGVVRNGLEPRVGEHAQRQRERELAPSGRRSDVVPLPRHDEDGAEQDEQHVRHEREAGDDDGHAVHLGSPDEAGGGQAEDHEDADQAHPMADG